MISLLFYDRCAGPDGCGAHKAVIWQGDCGCWVFKCLICGDVTESRCHEDEDHRQAFDDEASEQGSG